MHIWFLLAILFLPGDESTIRFSYQHYCAFKEVERICDIQLKRAQTKVYNELYSEPHEKKMEKNVKNVKV